MPHLPGTLDAIAIAILQQQLHPGDPVIGTPELVFGRPPEARPQGNPHRDEAGASACRRPPASRPPRIGDRLPIPFRGPDEVRRSAFSSGGFSMGPGPSYVEGFNGLGRGARFGVAGLPVRRPCVALAGHCRDWGSVSVRSAASVQR